MFQVKVKAIGYIRWDEDTDVWVSYMPKLNLYSLGPTSDEAAEALGSAFGMYISICSDKGMLDRVLKEAGLRIHMGPVEPDEHTKEAEINTLFSESPAREVETDLNLVPT